MTATMTEEITHLDFTPDEVKTCEHPAHKTTSSQHADGGEALYRITCPKGHCLIAVRCQRFITYVAAGNKVFCWVCGELHGIEGYKRIEGVS